MKSLEFMYWLQGFFEVTDSKTLDEAQVEKIRNHLKMVDIAEGKGIWPYCSWLNGFLDALEDTPNPKQVEKIKSKLNAIFEHVVMPAPTPAPTPSVQKRQLPPGVEAMC